MTILGLLKRFCKHLNKSTDGILQWKTKIYTPFTFQIFELCHDNASAGHFRIDRTYSKLLLNIFGFTPTLMFPIGFEVVKLVWNLIKRTHRFQLL